MAGRGTSARTASPRPAAAIPGQHGAQAVGTLGVPPPEVVVEIALVAEEEDGHASSRLQGPTTVAPMTGHRILAVTEGHLRIGPWRGDHTTAHLTPARGRPTALRWRGRSTS